MATKNNTKKGKILKTVLIVVGVILISFLAFAYINYLQVEKRGEKIVFLEDGNIKIANIDGSNIESLTDRKFEQLQNAKRSFCPMETSGECRVEDVSQSYFNGYFGEVMGISPDGRYLAATSYNKSIKNSIESNDKKFQDKYLTGSYWNPHYQTINIFDLKNKKFVKAIDMEQKTGEYLAYIGRIVWSPKDTDLTIFSMTGNYKINIVEESVTKVPNILSVYQTIFAYVPDMRKIYFIDLWGLAAKKEVEIYSEDIGYKITEPTKIISLSNERIVIDPVEGSKGEIYFATTDDSNLLIYKYDSFLGKLERLGNWTNPEFVINNGTGNRSYKISGALNLISPNGKYILLSNGKNEFSIINVLNWNIISNFTEVKMDVYSAKWKLDGEKIIYCSDKKLYEYSIPDSSKKEIMSFENQCPNSFHINYIN